MTQNLSEATTSTRCGLLVEANKDSFVFSIEPTSKSPLRVGDYVIAIDKNEIAVIGIIGSLTGPQSHGGESRASVTVLASLDVLRDSVTPGIVKMPSLFAEIFVASEDIPQKLAESVDRERVQGVALEIATLKGFTKPLAFPPEKIFGRHCAVVGTTGGGKSWSVARLIEECAKFQGKVILFDPSGEYNTLSRGVAHVHLGTPNRELPGSVTVSLPFFQLSESDLFGIFKPSGEAQAPKLRAAIRSLKLARLEPNLAPGGVIIKAHRQKLEYEQAYQHHIAEIENSASHFEIKKLSRQVQNECVHPQSSAVEPGVWGGINGVDLSHCATLISRIDDIVLNESFFPIFKPSKKDPSLFEIIEAFIKDPIKRVLCVSMEHLSFGYAIRETVMNALGRRLLEIARGGKMMSKPCLVVLDEAHQFINVHTMDEASSFSLNSFSMIAKEGRKYGLTCCLATQRPRDIPENVLSQMGTIFIHRLTNHDDVSLVESAAGNTELKQLASIATFSAGQAVIVGADFPIPLIVQMLPPSVPPRSTSSDFQRFWAGSSRAVVKE